MDIYRTAIPMRSFEHGAATREVAEAVVVRVAFADGQVGWGETHPRPYVTGETIETAARDLAETVWPACRELDFSRAGAFGEIPLRAADGRNIQAAACAMDLAASGQARFRKLAGGPIRARVSGVLGSSDPGRTAWRLRLMRLYGLRDFKLKLGLGEEIDAENLRLVHGGLGKAVAAGRCTLRVDANGAWDADSAPQRVAALKRYGVCAVEQPVRAVAAELAQLARRCDLPLIADESLLTADDALALSAEPHHVWWNVRLSKNGGLFRSLELATRAVQCGAVLVIGCMVGESSILSAAQRMLLQLCHAPRFVEGNYGRFLLRDDLTRRSLRFGYGGRLGPLRRPELSARADPRKIARYGTLLRTLER